MSRVRVVKPGDSEQPEVGFADTARATLERALAAGAVVIGIVWESPAGFESDSIPSAEAAELGLAARWVDGLYPDEGGDE